MNGTPTDAIAALYEMANDAVRIAEENLVDARKRLDAVLELMWSDDQEEISVNEDINHPDRPRTRRPDHGSGRFQPYSVLSVGPFTWTNGPG